jgi:drug/metabolite transporter (DMT)-like permease
MSTHRPARTRPRPGPIAALLLLCFLWSLGSLRSDLLQNLTLHPLPPMEKQAVPFALLAVTAVLFAVARRTKWPRGQRLLPPVLVGLGLFLAPAVLVSLTMQWVPELTRVALFSLAPVFAVVLEPHIGHVVGPQSKGALPAALAAVVGMLCIFPIEIPRSPAAGIAFGAVVLAAACVSAANCQAVRVVLRTPGRPIAPLAAIAGATAAVGLAASSVLMEQPFLRWDTLVSEAAWSAAFELPGLFLLFWLMRRMSAARMTTRFVLAPFVALLIGAVVLRPALTPRTWLGLLLVAGGIGWLLLAPEEEPEESAQPLNLNR